MRGKKHVNQTPKRHSFSLTHHFNDGIHRVCVLVDKLDTPFLVIVGTSVQRLQRPQHRVLQLHLRLLLLLSCRHRDPLFAKIVWSPRLADFRLAMKRRAAEWTCSTCTVNNDGAAVACEACGETSPHAWACPVCTVYNSEDAKACQACDTTRAQASFASAFLVAAQKKAASGRDVTVQLRLQDGTIVTLGGLTEESSISALYDAAREAGGLVGTDFVLLQPPGRRIDRSGSNEDTVGSLGLHRTTLSVAAAVARAAPAGGPAWRPAQQGGFVHSKHKPAVPATELRVCQLNVWFDEAFFAQRAAAQLRAMEEMQCDVMCLQEVTQPYLELVMRDPWVQRTFWLSHMLIESYGVMVLSRTPAARLSELPLPSVMGRSLVVAHLPAPLPAVATVHLESMGEYALTRVRQIAAVMDCLEPIEDAVLCGDFNFDGDRECAERAELRPQWVDPMPARPTMGVNYPSKKYGQARFDRILYKTRSWAFDSAVVFGDKRLPALPDAPQPSSDYLRARGAFLSDHLGLLARFKKIK